MPQNQLFTSGFLICFSDDIFADVPASKTKVKKSTKKTSKPAAKDIFDNDGDIFDDPLNALGK